MKRILITLTAGAALTLSAGAQAALTCSVAAVGVAFGNYNALALPKTDTQGTGTITVTCLNLILPTPVTIQLSKGAATSYSPRNMTFGANKLNYNVYSDAARTQIWGDGTGGSVTVSDTITALLGGVGTYTVYGTLFAAQNVPAGVYSDAITVTVNY